MKKIIIGLLVMGSMVFANPTEEQMDKISRIRALSHKIAIQASKRDQVTDGESIKIWGKFAILVDENTHPFYNDKGEEEDLDTLLELGNNILDTMKSMPID